MGLRYASATLTKVDYTSLATRGASVNLLNPTGNTQIAIGEVFTFSIQIQTSSLFAHGQTFWVNWAAFRPQQRSNYGQFGTGYRIDIINVADTGVNLAASATLSAGGQETTSQNYLFSGYSFSAGNTILQLDFIIFATNDTRDWIGSFSNDNTARWLLPFVGSNTLTQNVGTSAYRTGANPYYFEFWAYESTGSANNQPQSSFADAYVRNPADTTLKSVSVPVFGKWYDRGANNVQAWTPSGRLERNALDSITARLSSTSGQIITNIKRIPSPNLSDVVDNNFQPASAAFPRSLTYNGNNYIKAVFAKGTLDLVTIDRISARIINVGNISNGTDFYSAHQASENDIPPTNATPSPNWLNGGFFGTPTSTTILANTHTIEFLIDGTKLQFKGRYRIIFVVYDTTSNFTSTHISPELVADVAAPAAIGSPTTLFRGLQDEFVNSNTSASFWERMELVLRLDKSAYTGGIGAFNAQIQMVELLEKQGGNVLNRWAYSYQNLAGNANSLLYDASSGANFEIGFGRLNNYRAGQSTPLATGAVNYQYDWRVTFDQPTALGSQSITYVISNLVTVRYLDTTRIPLIRFLDAADFDASIITPVQRLCSTETELVVEVNKAGSPNPNANLAAFILQGITVQNGQAVFPNFEYENFSPTYLDQLASSLVLMADVDFGADNMAYYRLDLRALRSTNNTFSIGAIIYNI